MISKEKLEEVGKKCAGGFIFERVEEVSNGIYNIIYDLDTPCPVSIDLETMSEELEALVYYNFCHDDYYTRIGVIPDKILDNLLDYEYDGLIFSDLVIALEHKYFKEFKKVFMKTKPDVLGKIAELYDLCDILSAWNVACSVINREDFGNGLIIQDSKLIRPTWNEAVAAIREEIKKNIPLPVVKRNKITDVLYWEIPDEILLKLRLEEGDTIDWDLHEWKSVSIKKRSDTGE